MLCAFSYRITKCSAQHKFKIQIKCDSFHIVYYGRIIIIRKDNDHDIIAQMIHTTSCAVVQFAVLGTLLQQPSAETIEKKNADDCLSGINEHNKQKT